MNKLRKTGKNIYERYSEEGRKEFYDLFCVLITNKFIMYPYLKATNIIKELI